MDSNKETKFSIQYGPKDILDKKVKNKVRGYDTDEVVEFMDGIIRDYEAFTNEIGRLKEENTKLLSRVDELTKQLSVSKNVSAQTPQTNAAATNYDILKRLSNLERHVFGSKLSDSSVDNHDDGNHSDVDQY